MSNEPPFAGYSEPVVEGVSGALYSAVEAQERFVLCLQCQMAIDRGPVSANGECQACEPAAPADSSRAPGPRPTPRYVELTGDAPTTVIVDLVERRITRVRVSDEEALIDEPPTDNDQDWLEATVIAEQAEWPASEIG